MPMARKSAKLFFVACGRQAAKKSWNFLRWGSYCHCAEHESVNLIVCWSAVTCLVHTALPSGVVVSERVDHARMQTQMRAHRLFGEVDQRGGSGSRWIRVDQRWIKHISWFRAFANPWKTWETANGRGSCSRGNLCLYKIKREQRSVCSATERGAQGGTLLF